MARRKTKESRRPRGSRKDRAFQQFWSGTISFGLVSIPVQLLPARRNQRVAMREVDEDGNPLRRRFYCPAHQRLVRSSEIVRGFEIAPDQYVVVTDKELEALEPEKSRVVDLRSFVKLEEIPPLLLDRSYYMIPTGDSTKAYRLLAGALEQSGRAGIATFVMHEREYLIAIMGEKKILRGETLRFLDEVRDVREFGPAPPPKASRGSIARFDRLIEAHSRSQIDPQELEDEYAQHLQALVDRKLARGLDVVQPQPEEEPEEVDVERERVVEDLLETIRRSLNTRLHVGNGKAKSHRSHDASLGTNGSSSPKSTGMARRSPPKESTKTKAKGATARRSSPASGRRKSTRSKRRPRS
jgi:DNA end-binding protein Ku